VQQHVQDWGHWQGMAASVRLLGFWAAVLSVEVDARNVLTTRHVSCRDDSLLRTITDGVLLVEDMGASDATSTMELKVSIVCIVADMEASR
jgi:hypothetical protein